jgi:hypothetical protein
MLVSSYDRESLLASGVVEAGEAWAHHVMLCMRDDGRVASGGWYGTTQEARFRASAMLLPWLQARGQFNKGIPELGMAALQINSAARKSWSKIRDEV